MWWRRDKRRCCGQSGRNQLWSIQWRYIIEQCDSRHGRSDQLVTSALAGNTTITLRATNPVTSCSVLLTGTSVVTVNPIRYAHG
ncbi:MAG: hypothetical protein IPJ20_18460 [Flammeovirgaceae bacterium]|nr:hypothetical protein [Flammeovirgaceae bacterium]